LTQSGHSAERVGNLLSAETALTAVLAKTATTSGWVRCDVVVVSRRYSPMPGRERRALSFAPCRSEQTSRESAANFPEVTKATSLIRATLYDPDAALARDDLGSDANTQGQRRF
jgi:hypothetical protein